MREINTDDKIRYLAKYMWFDKEYAIRNEPYKVIAYAMRYADIDDYFTIFSLQKSVLKDVLKNAKVGWFDSKNWVFWHTILEIKKVPMLPKRVVL